MQSRTTSPHIIPVRDATDPLGELRDALIEQRQFRVEQINELATAGPAYAADEPHDQVLNAIKAAAIIALADIDAALDRLARGSYGRCESCRQPIPLERLEILPMAGLCTACQHAKEARRK
jgi:DnaK suppressor protein